MLLSKQFSTTNFSIIDAFMVASWPKKGRQKGSRPRWMARSDRWRCDPAIAEAPVLKSITPWGLQFYKFLGSRLASRFTNNPFGSTPANLGGFGKIRARALPRAAAHLFCGPGPLWQIVYGACLSPSFPLYLRQPPATNGCCNGEMLGLLLLWWRWWLWWCWCWCCWCCQL